MGRRSDTLAVLLAKAGFKPSALAEESGVSRNTVYRALAGKAPRPLYLAALADALDSTPARIRSAIQASAGAAK